MGLLRAPAWAESRRGAERPWIIAALALTVSAMLGILLTYAPAVAAGIAFLFLIAATRSREATVAMWLGLRVMMFSGYVPNGVGEVLLTTITLTALARRLASGRGIQLPRWHLLWLLLLLLVGLNLVYFGFDPESLYYARLIFGENILLLLLIANTESRWARDGVVTAVAVIVAWIGIVAAVEWIIGTPLVLNPGRTAYYESWGIHHTFEGIPRLGSILLQPNYLAAALALGFVVWTGLALETRGLRRLIAFGSAVGLLLVAFLTLSRTVFLGAAVGLAVLFVFALRKGRVSIGRATLAALAIAAAASIGLVLIPDEWLRITSQPTDPLRLGIYETALRIIAAHPLEGIGAGWLRYLALAEPYRATAQYLPLANPHNSFLEFAAMLGLPVALVIVLLVGKAFVQAWATPGASAIAVAGIAVLLAASLTEDAITIPVLSNLFWALWAVAVAGTRNPSPLPGARSRRDPLPQVDTYLSW